MSTELENKPLDGNDAKLPVRRSVTITMSLEVAETLHSFIDGGIGVSDSDDFNAEMIPLRDKLDRDRREAKLNARLKELEG
ncbi:hypothetical protein FW774_05970 [Pedobacter sp. BS3]|uniref:hypothetical protein n=1 Tax=Pedobacter sp. BS3 TaxID=2567937 RepID=UPI0011EC979B|nr:hypothetical protein [Pedobacter sp. BS3]TZF84533.1 hypothetical protein FW774_05970 [Pedobacter sp. BS3]